MEKKSTLSVRIRFRQGLLHKDYLYHLYEIFNSYCPSGPKINTPAPDKRTGNIYSTIYFTTYSLPCFKELYELFYPKGKKVVPLNIGVLLTTLSLAYWIFDDGGFDKLNLETKSH